METYGEEYNRISKELNIYATGFFAGANMPVERTFYCWQPWMKGYQGEVQLSIIGGFGPIAARIWIDQELKKQLTGR